METGPLAPADVIAPIRTARLVGARLWPYSLAPCVVALPLLVGGSLSPSSTFFNQAAAMLGWGVWLCVLAATRKPSALWPANAGADAGASLVLLQAALVSLACGMLASSTPWAQRLDALGPVAVCALVAYASSTTAAPFGHHNNVAVAPAVALAVLLAALYSVGVSLAQVFTPDWTNGWTIANATTEGRAIGNIRQPNQLSTLLVWGCAAAVWRTVTKRWSLVLLGGLLAVLVSAVVLTASRTGVIGVAMLALWGLVDRRLPQHVRRLLLVTPLFYALAWWGMTQWAAAVGHAFHGGERMTATLHGYGSDSRLNTWLNTWDLIKTHPWTGVGFGAYNFAWTMTPFPGRSVAFFDHSHNLVLQLAVELGIPLALLILGLLAASLWAGRRGLTHADDQVALSARTALFMLAVVGVHSMLEYPLWYTYFLFPTAALWGWYAGLAQTPPPADMAEPSRSDTLPTPAVRMQWQRWLIGSVGGLAVAGSIYAVIDFWNVAVIFEPQIAGANIAPLPQRIEKGRQGILFGQHADYARVTMAEKPEEVFESFDRPLFHLIDTRLMIAYAKALAGRGELEKARHVAARLREFRKPEAEEFFAVCAKTPTAFQCGPDPKLPYEALLPPGR